MDTGVTNILTHKLESLGLKTQSRSENIEARLKSFALSFGAVFTYCCFINHFSRG